MTRISTSSIHQRTINDMTRLQASMADLQKQISSGQKYDSFIGLGTNINRAQDLENAINSAKRYRDNNTVTVTRLNTMDSAVSQIQEIASQLSSALATENSPSSDVFDLESFARAALDQIESALNTTQAGRSLFAGSKTDQPAVGDLNSIINVVGGVANADYYNGDSFIASAQANDALSIDYGVTAGDPAFQNLIAALHKAIDLNAGGDSILSQQASDLLQNALQGLADIRTSLNTSRVTLEAVNVQHDTVQTQLNTAYGKLIGNDTDALLSATIESSLNEATLTATMQTFARMSNLSLVNFLK